MGSHVMADSLFLSEPSERKRDVSFSHREPLVLSAVDPVLSQPRPLVLSAADPMLFQLLTPCALYAVWCSHGVNQTQVPEHRPSAVLHSFTKPGLSVLLQETNRENF